MPILRAELTRPCRGRRDLHPDRRAVAGHPSGRPADFAGAVQRGRRADRRAGAARRAPVLRQLLGRPLARGLSPVLDAMLRFRVDELVLEFANREMAEVAILGEIAAAGGTSPPASSTSRTTTSSRPTRSPSGSTRSWRPACRGAADARPRLRLQPDRPLGDVAKLARSSPGATSSGARDEPEREEARGRPPDHVARHRAHRRLLTMTLHGQRGRDRVRVVYSRSGSAGRVRERGASRSRPDLRRRSHPDTDVVIVGLPNFLHEESGRRRRGGQGRARQGGRPAEAGGCSRRSSRRASSPATSRTSSTRRRPSRRSRPSRAGRSAT